MDKAIHLLTGDYVRCGRTYLPPKIRATYIVANVTCQSCIRLARKG